MMQKPTKKHQKTERNLYVNVNGSLYCQNVRIRAEADNLTTTDGGDEGFVAEFLTGMDIREMDFDGGHTDGRYGIAKSDAGVGKGRRIENYDVNFAFGFLNPGHKLALGVRLAKADLHPQLARALRDQGFDVRQGRPTVQVGLALAEQIQIWAVQN